MLDYLVLSTYALVATTWMLYVTDADFDNMRLYFTGFWSAGLGVLVAMTLGALKKRRDGRKQERRETR